MAAQFEKSREIAERVWVEGKLELETPARFGGGEADDLLDMPLLLDSVEQRALLTGASIAGALRNYLRTRECGDLVLENPGSLCAALFGRTQAAEEGAHSVLMTHDALSETPSRPRTELRDGVAIDGRTRTAEDKKKFDIELLAAGTQFKLRFELFLPDDLTERQRLLQALAMALQGFERGEIGLGARKRRGFGACRLIGQWTMICYALKQPVELVAWLKQDRTAAQSGSNITTLLLGDLDKTANLDQRRRFTLRATFVLDGSLLIRSGSGDVGSPDAVHLRSGDKPVLSGTSLAGVLRARAMRITNTLHPDQTLQNVKLVDAMFGVRHTPEEQKLPKARQRKLKASRLIVHETAIRDCVADRVQQRVKIDRFTGGAYPTGLFSEQPVFGIDQTEVDVHLDLLEAQDHEVGLLLLLLKDLWTGDLPLGGESSVGRGRLKGKRATLNYSGKGNWVIEPKSSRPDDPVECERLHIPEGAGVLETYVTSLARYVAI